MGRDGYSAACPLRGSAASAAALVNACTNCRRVKEAMLEIPEVGSQCGGGTGSRTMPSQQSGTTVNAPSGRTPVSSHCHVGLTLYFPSIISRASRPKPSTQGCQPCPLLSASLLYASFW